VIQLALETSHRDTSVCLLDAGQVIAQSTEAPPRPASVTLVCQIRQLLAETGHQPRDLQVVSVSIGPGSFTGLRLGVTTAKTVAYALHCAVVPVSTHHVIARQILQDGPPQQAVRKPPIATVIDALRGQWFCQLHHVQHDGSIRCDGPSSLSDPQEFLDSLPSGTVVGGTGLRRNPRQLQLPSGVQLAPVSSWQPVACRVGEAVAKQPDSFPAVEPFRLVPVYGRPSAAEEKLNR
jgi:tRNA threonylcarbamoyladenosine biosynthesis protein TsaB